MIGVGPLVRALLCLLKLKRLGALDTLLLVLRHVLPQLELSQWQVLLALNATLAIHNRLTRRSDKALIVAVIRAGPWDIEWRERVPAAGFLGGCWLLRTGNIHFRARLRLDWAWLGLDGWHDAWLENGLRSHVLGLWTHNSGLGLRLWS